MALGLKNKQAGSQFIKLLLYTRKHTHQFHLSLWETTFILLQTISSCIRLWSSAPKTKVFTHSLKPWGILAHPSIIMAIIWFAFLLRSLLEGTILTKENKPEGYKRCWVVFFFFNTTLLPPPEEISSCGKHFQVTKLRFWAGPNLFLWYLKKLTGSSSLPKQMDLSVTSARTQKFKELLWSPRQPCSAMQLAQFYTQQLPCSLKCCISAGRAVSRHTEVVNSQQWNSVEIEAPFKT